MSIIKYKYKLHKLVNSLFYVLVFSIGFFTGFLTNKIDFNKVISQFLMIDNVQAYTITSSTNSADSFDEEFIINAFKDSFYNFDYNDSPYILCSSYSGSTFNCMAMDKNMLDSLFIYNSNSSGYGLGYYPVQNGTLHMLKIESGLSISPGYSRKNSELPGLTNTPLIWLYTHTFDNAKSFTNFDLNIIDSSLDSYNSTINVLDFPKYIIDSETFTRPTSSNFYNEEFIYNIFLKINEITGLDLKFSDYNNVLALSRSAGVWTTSNNYTYYFSNGDYSGSVNSATYTNGNSYIYLSLDYYSSSFKLNYHTDLETPYILKSGNTNYVSATNGTLSTTYTLDFSEFEKVELIYDENLFANDPNFKKVCVDGGKSFAITPINGNYSDNGQYEDFIWFPYGLNSGLVKVQYDSSSEYANGNIIPYPQENMKEHFYFSSSEQIDNFYDTDLPSSLESAGYTDKYSYYGYDAYIFFIVYKDGLFRYPIFTLENPSKTHISSNGTIHGGGGLRLDGDEEIEISNNYCFYIKNDYNVSIVNVNEWGDYNGTVTSPDGDYDFNTSYNQFNSNTDNFLSQPLTFINSIKDTITFINSLIYELYMSLPVLLRTFIITVLIILMIMLIMTIGGYK